MLTPALNGIALDFQDIRTHRSDAMADRERALDTFFTAEEGVNTCTSAASRLRRAQRRARITSEPAMPYRYDEVPQEFVDTPRCRFLSLS